MSSRVRERDDEYHSTPRPSATSHISDRFSEFTDMFTLKEVDVLKKVRNEHCCKILKSFAFVVLSLLMYVYLMAEPTLFESSNKFLSNLKDFFIKDYERILDQHEDN